MFLLGSLSSLAPYVVMMIAYLCLFLAGGKGNKMQIDDASLLASESVHIIQTDNSNQDISSSDYHYFVYAEEITEQKLKITPPDTFVRHVFKCAACIDTGRSFIRFTFSLPPPYSFIA